MTDTDETFEAMTKLQDSVNELNRHANAQVNHGNDIASENKQEFVDFFEPKVKAVQDSYDKLISLL